MDVLENTRMDLDALRKKDLFIYFWLHWAFSSCGDWGLLFVMGLGLH